MSHACLREKCPKSRSKITHPPWTSFVVHGGFFVRESVEAYDKIIQVEVQFFVGPRKFSTSHVCYLVSTYFYLTMFFIV